MEERFAYDGPEALRDTVTRALKKVVDPEVAMDIVDVGLVYAVRLGAKSVAVRMTMTSAACPVADMIMEDVQAELQNALPDYLDVEVELVWEPPWTAERLSASAKRFMGW